MKKKAWTLAEILIALLIAGCFASLFVFNMKTDDKKGKIFSYSAVDNLMNANTNLIYKFDKLNLPQKNNGLDWYCANLADLFTLADNSNCNSTASEEEANIVLPNGISYYGLAQNWEKDKKTYYKDIMIDIDGSKGPNQAYKDRIPMRLYSNGKMRPIDCPSESTNKYCNTNLGSEALITYDIYTIKQDKETMQVDTRLLAKDMPYINADCMAYGGKKLYSEQQCREKSINQLPECAFKSGQTPCFATLHKPKAGVNMFVETFAESL